MGDATGPHLPDATIAPEPGARTERAPDASMELLNSIQRETIDPEYAAVASEGLGRSRAPVLVLVIGLLAGLMFTTSGFRAGVGAKDAAGARTELITQIGLAEQRVQDSRTRATQLNAEIEQIERERLGDAHLPSEPDLIWSGQVSVIGPGIVLTINDNPKDANGTLVDQDLRQVANGLWLAGAEAISINGHRLSARTAIRQAGAAITVDYRSLTTPYRIEAIGDPGALESGFTANSGGAWLNYLRRNYGVSWAIERRKEVQLGPDAGLAVGHAGVA